MCHPLLLPSGAVSTLLYSATALSPSAVIPSLLIPLHNPLKVLRNGAMACLKVIHDAVDGLPHSTHAEALMTAPMLHLVIAIVQHSFDIASDPDYLPNVLRKLFSKKETKGTPLRLRCHDREGSLPALSNVMSVVGQTDAPPWVKAALLRQLCLVHHPIKVSACAALLRELVELDRESLTGDEDALLSALLSGYTPGAAGLLGACPDAMAVFVDVLRGKNMRGTPCQLQALQQVIPERTVSHHISGSVCVCLCICVWLWVWVWVCIVCVCVH